MPALYYYVRLSQRVVPEVIRRLGSIYNVCLQPYNWRDAKRCYVVTGRGTSKWSEPEIGKGNIIMKKKTTQEEQNDHH